MSQSFQEMAERVAEASINRFGFVVVSYTEDDLPSIGKREDRLWRWFQMPQPFVVAREATEQERATQVRLFKEMTGLKPHPGAFEGKPYALVTD